MADFQYTDAIEYNEFESILINPTEREIKILNSKSIIITASYFSGTIDKYLNIEKYIPEISSLMNKYGFYIINYDLYGVIITFNNSTIKYDIIENNNDATFRFSDGTEATLHISILI